MGGLIINGIHYDDVKFAITKKEQRVGLMWRDYPTPIMIFPYKTAEIRKFWMKNVFVPLDLIYANNRKIIEIVKGSAFDESLIGPNKLCDLIVETPAGFCNENNIKIGDNIKIKYDKKTLIKIMFNN
jgi:hypothetical protein